LLRVSRARTDGAAQRQIQELFEVFLSAIVNVTPLEKIVTVALPLFAAVSILASTLRSAE
jgi:hypothetical protein